MNIRIRSVCVGIICALVLGRSSVDASELRLMTFNVKGDSLGSLNPAKSWVYYDLSNFPPAVEGPGRRDRVTSVIDAFGPDILSVQELKLHQRNDLLDALPEMSFYGQGRGGGENGDANGIYFRTSRFDLLDQGDFWLSETSSVAGTTFFGYGTDTGNPRMATWVKLLDHQTNQTYFVLSTHWSLDSQARRDSAALIQENILSLADDLPILVLGDLNTSRYSSAYRTLLGRDDPSDAQLIDSFIEAGGVDGRTYHDWQGGVSGTRIDHILHSPNDFTARSAGIVRTTFDGGLYPSDHYPVTTVLTVVPEPTSFGLAGIIICVLVGAKTTGARRLRQN